MRIGNGNGNGKKKKNKGKEEEVDYKSKSGTAWSHSYLNQKPWHPLSYPNQRRKWIAEQTHANRLRRADEVAREYAQEQEFFRQTSLLSNDNKEKMEIMRSLSFMYVRPPGYDAAAAADTAADTPKDVFGRSLPTDQNFPVLKNAPRYVSNLESLSLFNSISSCISIPTNQIGDGCCWKGQTICC